MFDATEHTLTRCTSQRCVQCHLNNLGAAESMYVSFEIKQGKFIFRNLMSATMSQ